MKEQVAPIDRLPPDVRALVDSTMKLLGLYMPSGQAEISMCVGRNMTATLRFSGGPITKEVIEDTLAHLAFYKKYFPKTADEDSGLSSPEKILNALAAMWEDHRRNLPPQQIEHVTGS